MSSEVLTRVSFRFRRELEVRYLAQVPEVGDHVTHASELWVVMEVDEHESDRSSFASFPMAPRMLDGVRSLHL